MPVSGLADLKRAEVWWRPLVFWFGVSAVLLLVFGVAYAYAKSLGTKVSAGAVKLRDVATWTAADDLVFRERSDGVLERVYGRNDAPETAEVSFLLGEDAQAGPTRGGALIMSQKDKDDEEEDQAPEDGAAADEVERARQQEAARLRRLSELGYTDGAGPLGELTGIAVGAYSSDEARALLEQLRASGREGVVQEITDPATGEKRYRVNAGAAADASAAARLSSELAREGIGGKQGTHGNVGAGPARPAGTTGTTVAPPQGANTMPPPPREGGGATVPAPTVPPAGEPAKTTRPVGDL